MGLGEGEGGGLMATSTKRRKSSYKKHRSPSEWWTHFKKTDRYRVVSWIVRITGRLIVVIADRSGAEAKLRSGAKVAGTKVATGSKRVGGSVVSKASSFGHDRLDLRELRAGVLTDAEYDSWWQIVRRRPDDVSEEQAFENWLEVSLAARRVRHESVSLFGAAAPTFTPAAAQAVPAFQPPSAFQPPTPRHSAPSRPAQPVPPRRPAVRKVNRPAQLRAAWGVKFDNMKGPAMAADGNLSGAMAQLRSFVDQQPGDRMQLHAQLAAFAQFFEGLGEIAEAMQATLERPLPDGTPGVPSSVTQHLGPVAEHGAQIGQCAKDTALAWEDRFADAIRVAQDEEKPSDEYLRAPA